jgi:tripartite-type tricarboxylate transporter receptor subunit TctC
MTVGAYLAASIVASTLRGRRVHLYAMALPVSAAPAFLQNMPFRLESDFAPVIKISTSYDVLVVNPSVPARSVSDLVALLKGQPDKLTFSSGGFGTPAHLIGEMFKLQTGVHATHVPYSQFFASHCGPLGRDQPLHVHYDPAGRRPDR